MQNELLTLRNTFWEHHEPAAPNARLLYAYMGREWDADAALYYYRHRWYEPPVGRFLSEDPVGFAAGDANLVRYVGNSPVNFVDPYGLQGGPAEGYAEFMAAQYRAAGLRPADEDFAAWREAAADAPYINEGGPDALDFSANFAAAALDHLTMNTTWYLREWMGHNGGIDCDSIAYSAGQLTALGMELAATGGAVAIGRAIAREAAERIAREAAERIAREAAERIAR